MITPKQPELRGTCEQAAKKLASENPDLTVVRGWYIDLYWGEQEHWWCVDQSGTIHDPTVEQFPTGHLPNLREYREFTGVYPCSGCGIPVSEDDASSGGGYCCGACYGSDVGIYAGRCECS